MTDLPLLSMAQWPPDRLAGDRKLSGAVRKVLPAGYHAEFGRYVDSLQALTPVVLHRFRTVALADLLRRDAGLEFPFLC